jgi:hypothetical protein
MPDPVGFYGHIPAALRFVEATEQQIHLLVQHPLRMVAFLKAAGALAEWHIKRCHTHILNTERAELTPIVHRPLALR